MIILDQSVIVVQPVSTDKFTIDLITDSPKDKTVIAQVYPLDEVTEVPIQGTVKFLTLWEGTEYDSIGNWTQEQAEDKIIELLEAQ
jgi:hypothetical protein